MKKSTLVVLGGIVAGLIVGFMIGLFVDFPKIDRGDLSGTIRKVDNYRNAKATEADIQLQNALVSDTVALKMLQNYITFHYLDAIKMAGDIDKAVTEANATEPFKTSGKAQIEGLANYGLYLSSSRLHFLAALATCKDPEHSDPAWMRNSLNQVNNVIAQKNYRNHAVLDFISQAEAFIATDKSGDNQGLRQIHDLLALDMINASVITGDKLMQKFLGKKALMTDVKKLNWYDNAQTMKQVQQDMEKLAAGDAEKMGYWDAEKLNTRILDADRMGMGYLDIEKMGIKVFDSEKLGIVWDSEKMSGALLNAEKLGIHFDAEKMNQFMDQQKLGYIVDAEQMGLK